MSLASPRFVSERLPRQPIKLAKWQAGSTRFEPKPKGNGMEYNGSVQDHLQERFRVWVNLDSYRNPGFGFGGLRVHTPNT